MIYTILLSSCDNQELVRLLKKFEDACSIDNATSGTQMQFACLHYNKKNCVTDKTVWKSLDETHSSINTHNSSNCEYDLKQTSEDLHQLADGLPSTDIRLDIYIWPPKGFDKSDDYCLLLGVLRRLKDWHNAKVTLFDPELTSDTEFLQKFTCAAVHVAVEDVDVCCNDQVWRGKVAVTDKVDNKGICVAGVSLHKQTTDTPELTFPVQEHNKAEQITGSSARLGRMIEVLDELELTSVPAIFHTPHTYRLCLYQKLPASQVLMAYLRENHRTGLLARLPVYSSKKRSVKSCADVGLSTVAWKENIMADIQYVQEPEEDLQDNYEFLYFLITAPDKYSPVENFVAHAHLLQHPYALSGTIATSIYHQALCPIKGDNHHDKIYLSGLPLLTTDTLHQLEKDIVLIQRVVIQRILAEKQAKQDSTQMNTDKLANLLNDFRMLYLDKLKQKLPLYGTCQPTLKLDANRLVYEAGTNSYDWPEKLVQQYLESQKRTLSRIQSSESMPMSSPIPACEGVSSSVDIQSFLLFFQADGSASCDKLSPVRRRRASRCQSKLSAPDMSSPALTWPDSKDCSSHDVYYNIDRKSEKMNSHMNRLQEKLVKNETYSSCLSPVVLFPKSVKRKCGSIDRPELRRSPRKKPPARKSSCSVFSDMQKPLSVIQEDATQRRYSLPHGAGLSRSNSGSSSKSISSRRVSDVGCKRTGTPVPQQVSKLRRESDADYSFITPQSQGSKKESRSERHKRRLQDIVDSVLRDKGVSSTDPIYKSCSSRLYKVTKLFVMDLPNSINLKEEMKIIAQSQVDQVIQVDRNRQTATQKTRQRHSKS